MEVTGLRWRGYASKVLFASARFWPLWIAIHNGKRLSDAALKLARRTAADGVG
jgi:hypothetical protein